MKYKAIHTARIALFLGAALCLFIPLSPHAMETTPQNPKKTQPSTNTYVYKMASLKDLSDQVSNIRKIYPNAKIVTVFDWDNTVSLINGCELPLREENTKEAIQSLVDDFQVNLFILTSRLTDNEYPKEDYQENVTKMTAALPLLQEGGYEKFSPTDQSTIICMGNIIYTNNKGEALFALMNHDYFGKNVDYLLFIDNDATHIKSVQEAYKQQSHQTYKVFLFYYPQNPLRTDKDNCESTQSIPLLKTSKPHGEEEKLDENLSPKRRKFDK